MGCLHSLLLEETLLCSPFTKRSNLDTGNWLETRVWLDFDAVPETRPWRGCTSLPSSFCNISLLLSRLETGAKLPPSFSMMATASKISIYSGSSDWPDTGKGQDDWDSTFYDKTLQLTIVWIILFLGRIFVSNIEGQVICGEIAMRNFTRLWFYEIAISIG